MIIRIPYHSDKEEIDRIYNKFFSDNEYPNFFDEKTFSCPFVVASNDDKIIVAGGVKIIVEAIVVSDQELPTKTRLDALLQSLGSIISITKSMKHNQIHVFVNDDEKYIEVLQKFGFRLLNAKVLILDLGESHG